MNLPRAGLRAFGGHIAATGLSVEFSLYTARRDVSRPGVQIDVARGDFFNLDIPAAGATLHSAGNWACADVARARLQLKLARQVRQLQVARPGLRVDVAVRAFNNLVARAATGTNRGIRGHADLVVHGNVSHVHVLNVNAIAVLPDRRILFDLVDVGLAAAHQPVVAHVDLSTNEDGSPRTGAHGDVARTRENFKIDGAAHLQRPLELALEAGSKNSGRGKQHDQRDRKRCQHRSAGHGKGGENAAIIHSVVTPQVSYPRRAGQDTCPRSR